MKRLKAKDYERLQSLIVKLQAGREDLYEKIDEINGKISELVSEAQIAVDEYNSTIEDARSFTDDITREAEDYYDARSEGWQNGDAGEALQQFIYEWSVSPCNVEIENSDITVEIEGIDEAIDLLENLPTEVE